jgi:hypothetical protein
VPVLVYGSTMTSNRVLPSTYRIRCPKPRACFHALKIIPTLLFGQLEAKSFHVSKHCPEETTERMRLLVCRIATNSALNCKERDEIAYSVVLGERFRVYD